MVVLVNLPSPEVLTAKSSVRDNLTPFQGAVSYLSRQFRGMGWYLSGVWHASESEQNLRAENAQLRRDIWRLRRMEDENRELRKMVDFKQQRPERLLIAEVIARGDSLGWWQTVRLNRGTADGVRPDLPVLTPQGLVGRTSLVSEHTCEVLLITDPASQVSCRVGQGGSFGILKGEGISFGGDPKLAMLYSAAATKVEFLSTEQNVAEGDEVATAGLGGVYPAGIPVGRVKSVRLDPSQLYMNAAVTPLADLQGLYYVFVILTRGPTI